MAYKQKWVRVATQDADKRGRASARPLVNCRSASIRVAVPAWLFFSRSWQPPFRFRDCLGWAHLRGWS